MAGRASASAGPCRLSSRGLGLRPRLSALGPTPSEGPYQSGSGSSDPLAPVVFRFTDTAPPVTRPSPSQPSRTSLPSSPSGAATPGPGSASLSPAGKQPSSASNGTNGNGSGHASKPAAPPAASASGTATGVTLPAVHMGRSQSSGSATTGADPADGQSPSSSAAPGIYSDYYRNLNTPYSGARTSTDASVAAPPSHTSTARSSSSAAPPPPQAATASPDRPATPSSSNGASGSAGSSSGAADAADVADAIARAQAALAKAESSLDDMQRLNDTSLDLPEPPTKWQAFVRNLRSAAVLVAAVLALEASHAFGLVLQWFGAAVGAAGIAVWGLRRGALAQSGAVAAAVVGMSTLGSSLRFGAVLLAFFFSSSKLTQYKEELKEGLDDSAKKGGQRDWVQVFCNSLVPTVLAVVYGVLAGCVDLPLGPAPPVEPWRSQAVTALMGGFLGYYACCCGDTWASELGPLSADTPRLITSLRPVRRGTNGGVTLLGLSASIMGGMFVGLVFYLAGLLSPTLWIFEQQRAMAAGQWRLIPLGLVAGLLGSVLDSVLGATLQYSGYNTATGRVTGRPGPGVVHISGLTLMDNNAVNAASATATAALTALLAVKVFVG